MKAVVTFLTLICLSMSANANELQARRDMDDIVKELVFQDDYSTLEAMANSYRNEESRTSSGLWNLTLFYYAFDNIVPKNIKDKTIWIRLMEKMDRWIQQNPSTPTPYIAKSIIQKRHAWSIRGTGFAKTVKKEDWKPFHEKIEASRQTLTESQSLSSKDPHWYEVMANIATIQAWEESEFERLVERGLELSPYYFQLYFSAMEYYAPKWHGNAKKIESFARASLERTKSKEGYGLYARIYWSASQSQFQSRLFEKSDVDWETMSKGIDDILDKYPDQWNVNNFAFFSCMAEDKNKTYDLIKRINGEPIRAGWLNNLKIFEYCKNWSLGNQI